jgi:hypothetical protein
MHHLWFFYMLACSHLYGFAIFVETLLENEFLLYLLPTNFYVIGHVNSQYVYYLICFFTCKLQS